MIIKSRLSGYAADLAICFQTEQAREKLTQAAGVTYYLTEMRKLFVKGRVEIFLYRFTQLLAFRRQQQDLIKWIIRWNTLITWTRNAWNDSVVAPSKITRQVITDGGEGVGPTITTDEEMQHVYDARCAEAKVKHKNSFL